MMMMMMIRMMMWTITMKIQTDSSVDRPATVSIVRPTVCFDANIAITTIVYTVTMNSDPVS